MKQKTFGCSRIKEFKTDPDIQEDLYKKDIQNKIKKEVDIQNQYDKGVRKG